jgi:TolB-like protein/Tfp pilus assembly protein PilF
MPQVRRLAAIMFTDIVGYTRLMGNDEQKAFEILQHNRQIQFPVIAEFHGKMIKELGDGVLASFETVTDAVNAAMKIQEACRQVGQFQLRIGIHIGEVVFENNDVFGDGVNVASRIQAVAKPGSVFVSEPVRYNISNKRGLSTRFVDRVNLKNVADAMSIYEVVVSDAASEDTGKYPKEPFLSEKSIAVLPFVNLSGDAGQEYFSDGITEEILNSLSHLNGLKVTGRTSSFQFRGQQVDIREVGKRLGVRAVLEGSVRKYGNRIRITAQLINVEDGFHLWSERFDREMDDIFLIQEEIALAIVEKLKIAILGTDRNRLVKPRKQNTQAYHYYLQGRYFWNKRTEKSLNDAIRYFQKAIDIQPDYALAWAGVADSCNLMIDYVPNASHDTQKAKNAVLKALELDNELAEAHISFALLLMLDEWDWQQAGQEFRRGIELNPNYATAYHWYAEWLMYTGNLEKALEAISKAAELDPVSAAIIKDKGLVYYYSRQFDQAIETAKTVQEFDPDFVSAHRLMSLAYQARGEFDLSIRENSRWQELTGNRPKSLLFLAQIYAAGGHHAEARKTLATVTEQEIIGTREYRTMALIHIGLGEYDEAFAYLEKSFTSHELSLCSIKVDPKLDPIRSDPRFELLIRKIGLSEQGPGTGLIPDITGNDLSKSMHTGNA